jgi:tripartite-type tricarboxylate transporter receptor subunit TctC
MPEEVKKSHSAIEKAVKHPEGRAKIEKLGYVVEYRTPAEMRKQIVDDLESAGAVAAALGLKK